MPLTITLLRHGQTTSNAAGIWQGQGDASLSELGAAQALAAAARLADAGIDRVVSSDLRRAMQTAEAVGLPVEPDPGFRELDLGRWEGLTREEVHARWPQEVEALRRGEDVAVGGGESWGELERRTRAALDALEGRVGVHEHVLLVAHGGVIITLMSSLMGAAEIRPRALGKLGNAGFGRVERAGARWRLTVYNDCGHVTEQAPWRASLARGRVVEPVPPDPDSLALVTGLFPGRRVADLAPLPEGRVGLLEVQGSRQTLAAWNVALPKGL